MSSRRPRRAYRRNPHGLVSNARQNSVGLRRAGPAVERVRLALHVLRAVRELDELEPVPLVQAPRRILLKDPEVELPRPQLLRLVEQRSADSPVLLRRLHVQLLEDGRAETRRLLDPEEAE